MKELPDGTWTGRTDHAMGGDPLRELKEHQEDMLWLAAGSVSPRVLGYIVDAVGRGLGRSWRWLWRSFKAGLFMWKRPSSTLPLASVQSSRWRWRRREPARHNICRNGHVIDKPGATWCTQCPGGVP